MGDEERPSWADREKKSFSELDRLRRERGSSSGAGRPQGPADRARNERATRQYLSQIDGLFSEGKGGAAGKDLARAVRDARGTPGLAGACRAYREALGRPDEASLIACFLDCGNRDIVLDGLGALRDARKNEAFAITAGVRTQLRMLSSESDDEVAEAAEELLEEL